MKSWKTTVGALIALLPSILAVFGVHIAPDMANGIVSVGAGLGLMAAKDANVTGGTVDNGQVPK
jgi:hypothetical protein